MAGGGDVGCVLGKIKLNRVAGADCCGGGGLEEEGEKRKDGTGGRSILSGEGRCWGDDQPMALE